MRKILSGVCLAIALAAMFAVVSGSGLKVATNMGPDPMMIQVVEQQA
jgi:Na+(H+)/acetate symporter ActP